MARSPKSRKKVDKDNQLVSPKPLRPRTEVQMTCINNYFDTGKHQLLLGYPGVGKTYLALHLALLDLEEQPKKYNKIIIIRSPVQTRSIGHTPGTLEEKAAMYEGPYPSIVNKVCGRGDAYGILKKKDVINFELTTFLRGDTFDNAIVIMDEFQNCTAHEADTVLTRLGKHSKLIIAGDLQQRDLTSNREKNIEKFLNVIEHMPKAFNITYFTEKDIVRSDVVADYIKTKQKLYSEGYST